LNKNGEYQGLSDEEEEMIDFNEAWNEGEQQARQQLVKLPMRIDTTSATSRRVTISHQKPKKVLTTYNSYKKCFTNRRTTPSSRAIRVDDKENPAATVVLKKKRPPWQQYLPQNGLALSPTAKSAATIIAFPASQSK